jgi:chromosome partitioning protein
MHPVGKLTGDLLGPPGRVRDSRFLDAAMAAAALVACAGGAVDSAGCKRLDRILDTFEDLKAFDAHLAAHSFDAFARSIRIQGRQGRAQALKAVSDIAGDAGGARLVIKIGRAAARAGAGLAPAERQEIEAIADAAGVRAPDFGDKAWGYGNAGDRRPLVITLGSAKGGTGKSTTAVHLAVGLVRLGYRVGSLDLDGAQGTMSRYLANRAALAEETGQKFGMSRHRRIEPCRNARRDLAEHEERTRFGEALADLADCAYVVVDTPGNEAHLARLGCLRADILITPLNDSFLDVDVLARVDRRKREVLGPSSYCKLVWEENDRRVAAGRQPIEWIVMRNRLAHLDARNNREVSGLLQQLSRRIGFRLEHGLSERVVFRELFLQGLTLLDLHEGEAKDRRARASHAHARQEIDALLRMVVDLGRERRWRSG